MPKTRFAGVLIVVAAVIVLYVLGVVLFGTGGVEPGRRDGSVRLEVSTPRLGSDLTQADDADDVPSLSTTSRWRKPLSSIVFAARLRACRETR